MADTPLTPSDDQQDQPLRQLQEEAAEDNGNDNNGDSRSRTPCPDDASAGDDDDGTSFGGTDGTGSDADDEDRGALTGTDLKAGDPVTLTGGDQQPATTGAVIATATLTAMSLTSALSSVERPSLSTLFDFDLCGHVIDILSYLTWKEVLLARVCKYLQTASKLTPVADLSFRLPDLLLDEWRQTFAPNSATGDDEEGRRWLKRDFFARIHKVLPRLQGVRITDDETRQDGIPAYFALQLCHLHRFVELRRIAYHEPRNLILGGRVARLPFPVDFGQFQHLEEIDIMNSLGISFDLSDFSDLKQLKKLQCGTFPPHDGDSFALTGELHSLEPLRNTLEVLRLEQCVRVTGDWNNLSCFQKLRKLKLYGCTSIRGTHEIIRSGDFPSLENLATDSLRLGYGGSFCTKKEEFLRSITRLMRCVPTLRGNFYHMCFSNFVLGENDMCGNIAVFRAGPRLGYYYRHAPNSYLLFEFRWLDPEPLPDDEGYVDYVEQVKHLKSYSRISIQGADWLDAVYG